MSKVLPLVSLFAVTALTAGVAWQANTIANLRGQLAAATAASAEHEKAALAERKKIVALEESNAAFKVEAKALRENHPEAAIASTASPTQPKDKAAGFAEAMGKMMSSPEMKKMMRSQQEMAVRMMYGDLMKELGLSPEENDRLLALLAERQTALTESSMGVMSGERSQAALAELSQQTSALNAKYDGQLQAALGDRYDRYREYEKSLGERTLLQQYSQQMAGASQPLNAEQNAGLLQIMSEERARLPTSPFNTGSRDVAKQIEALGSDEQMHTLFAQQEEFNRRVLERAPTVLTPEQVAAFTEVQQRMMKMQEMGVQMSRTMFKPAK